MRKLRSMDSMQLPLAGQQKKFVAISRRCSVARNDWIGKESGMLTRRFLLSAISVLGIAWAAPTSVAQEKETLPKPDKMALGEDAVKQLLLLMDTDKNGKISKKEWMDFMEAEFDRLDKDKSGDLDVREIALSRLRATRHVNTGK